MEAWGGYIKVCTVISDQYNGTFNKKYLCNNTCVAFIKNRHCRRKKLGYVYTVYFSVSEKSPLGFTHIHMACERRLRLNTCPRSMQPYAIHYRKVKNKAQLSLYLNTVLTTGSLSILTRHMPKGYPFGTHLAI